MYDGSGGGTGVDISETGLEWIQYVKIYQEEGDWWSAEIDALSDVASDPLEAAVQNIKKAIACKKQAKELINNALKKERAAREALSALEDSGQLDEFEAGEIVTAKQRIHSA